MLVRRLVLTTSTVGVPLYISIYICVYIYIDIDSDMQVTRARGHALFPFPLPSMVPSLMVMMVVRLIAIKVQNVRHRPTTTVCGVFQGTTIDLHG